MQDTPTGKKEFPKNSNWIKMTDQKAEVAIENVERYAREDTKPESDGNLDMNPNPSWTSKSMCSIIIDSTFLAFTAPGVEVRFVLTFITFEKLIHKLSMYFRWFRIFLDFKVSRYCEGYRAETANRADSGQVQF